MKRLTFLVLALVLVLTGTMVIGCGGGGSDILDEVQNQGQSPDDDDEETPSSVSPSSSDDDDSEGPPDIPIYPGADQIAKVDTEDNSLSKPRTIQQRIYRTGDGAEEVADFYRDKMKDNGWEELSWTEMQDGYIGMYEKGTFTSATITITPYAEGGSAITIITAYPD